MANCENRFPQRWTAALLLASTFCLCSAAAGQEKEVSLKSNHSDKRLEAEQKREREPTHAGPNIVFILVDDLGWKDVGCYGSAIYETPNLDKLASEGMRFTDAYAAAPVCSPTRASIMTGKYPARVRITAVLGRHSDHGLASDELTPAEVLKSAGYATASIGKWHLGGRKALWPENQGFDVNIGGTGSGMPNSFFWPGWKGNPPIRGNVQRENLTDRLTDEAVRFIEAHAEEPFFLYLSYYAVHIPIEGKPDKVAKYRAKLKGWPPAGDRQDNPRYAAMVETVDDGVGRLMDTIRRLSIDNRTVVFFFSDNGGLSVRDGRHGPATSNAPLRAGKGYLYEGGIRVPCIVKWPGATPPGSVCRTPIISVDFFPTIVAMAGLSDAVLTTNGPIDGLDISALLKDATARLERGAIYWHYPHYDIPGARPGGAIRAGDWKLIERYDAEESELYCLKEDLSETTNLAEEMPDQVRLMDRMLTEWREQVQQDDKGVRDGGKQRDRQQRIRQLERALEQAREQGNQQEVEEIQELLRKLRTTTQTDEGRATK